jgi:DNA repair protein RadC
MKLADLPSHTKPREKLQARGHHGLTDAELLAILLRIGYKGTNAIELAERILKKYPLAQLLSVSLPELMKFRGIGVAQASCLSAAIALAQRLDAHQAPLPVSQPSEVAHLMQPYRHRKQEYLVCFYLDARHQLLDQRVISQGTVNSSLIHPREVFAPALELRASGVILAHNHPSGITEPSPEDLVTTEKVVAAGDLLDIPVLDHVIVSARGWYSLRSQGLI